MKKTMNKNLTKNLIDKTLSKIGYFFAKLSFNKMHRFKFLLILILLIIIWGIFIKIYFFNLLIYYYLFLCLFFILKTYVISNKYFDIIFSESNIIIRLIIPIIIYILFGYNIIFICLVKFLTIILVRIYFLDKLSSIPVIFTFIFCLCSSLVSPIISVWLFELCIFSENCSDYYRNWMFPRNERQLPDWLRRAQEQQDFQEHQKELQEMLKNTEHGRDYNELVPVDVNDFNIAKANNAFNALERNAQGFYGQIDIGKRGWDLLHKIRNDAYINDGSPIHSKFTYHELAVLKYFGKNFNLYNIPGYNGVAHHGPFTNTEPYNIEITRSISSNSDFGKRLENDIYHYKKNINDWIIASNNKTWNLIE